MSADETSPLQPAPAPAWDVPEVSDVKTQRKNYRPRKPRNFDSPIEPVKNAVEVVVTLESPMPIRAMAPVLYVGDVQLTESEALGKEGLQIRFWCFDQEELVDGAPIHIGWLGSPRDKRKLKYKFSKPQ